MVFGNRPELVESGVPSHASKQVFNIKDLSTKSVVLYSTRAHITREIDNVLLKPGTNEVEIYGLSPTVDEHSIQIEGQGTTTIVDLTVELVPNRDIFEEIYPEDSDSSDDESDAEYVDSDDDDEIVRQLSIELRSLELQVTEATETQNSATERLATLDRYAKSVTAEHNSPEDITKLLKKYQEDRQEAFKIHSTATQDILRLQKKIKRKEYDRLLASKEGNKKKAKIERQKAKNRRRKELQKAEQRKEKTYIKQERQRYWPKKVYKITLLLEGSSLDTPGSSRRNSIDTVTLASTKQLTKAPDESATPQTSTSLLLSYVTKEAGWSPRYDLRISSLHKTATIIYRTEFLNRTAETWKDAKLSFSTSQTSYQGLDDVVPFMHAWRIKLSRYDNGDGGLLSPEEASKQRIGRPTLDTFNRTDLFGLDDNYIPVWQSKRPLQVQQSNKNATGGIFSQNVSKPGGGGLFGSSINNNNAGASNFGSSLPAARGGFGSNIVQVQDIEQGNANLDVGISSARSSARLGSSLFSKSRKKEQRQEVDDARAFEHTTEEDSIREDDAGSLSGDDEETSWEDNGLTATYDVPGIRTLAPSSMTRRHKIAALNATNIHLSHICVPKLRSAAFLRAKIKNPSSSVTLLKGSAGVTLDGSFLGNMNLPRVSPNQTFDLPLGVDPAIHINYPKPNVHRSTSGMIFAKESAQVFSRSIWLNNTKPSSVDLLVLDQVPVSEDERLRVLIMTPRGLAKEGDAVKAGVSAKEGSSGAVERTDKGGAWGNAVAKLKKGGEIAWTVKIEGGKGCLLKLEYEARMPPSEKIVPA